jgi:hypothetical protein
MLTIRSGSGRQNESGFCDGVSRRNFLKIGALGMGGLTLPQLLRAEAGQGVRKGHKAVIMIFLPGGPSHQDMFDMKPDAPAEFRGEFKPIDTNVPGIQVCEHLPKIARLMDKCAIVRSIVGATGGHDAHQCLTGRSMTAAPPGGWPSLGSTLSKLYGPVDAATPPFVGLSQPCAHAPWGDAGSPGFLGIAHAPFKPSGAGKADMVLNGVSLERLADRRQLLSGFDRFRRGGRRVGADGRRRQLQRPGVRAAHQQQAPPRPRPGERRPEGRRALRQGRPAPARRRAPQAHGAFPHRPPAREAGARCVTLAFSRWDHHDGNFGALRQDLPLLDQGVSALIEDIHARGLDKDVSVVVWGEFGRTPTINKEGGRDHWPNVSCGLLFGGGMKVGQVIGSTDRIGGEAKDRPLKFGDVFATLYHNLGIDPHAPP